MKFERKTHRQPRGLRAGILFPNHYSLTTILSLITLLFSACPVLISSSHEELPSPEQLPGKGSFSLYLEGQSKRSRSVQPGQQLQLSDFAAYDFAFYAVLASGGDRLTYTARRDSGDFSEPVFLMPGAYNLRVTAYRDAARTQPAAWGELPNLVVAEGLHGSGVISLWASKDRGGAGTFSWDIDFPADVTLASITVTKMPSGAPQTFASPAKIDSAALDSGQYLVVFALEKADTSDGAIVLTGKTVQWREALHIYSSLESKFRKTFSADLFTRENYIVTFEDGYGGIVDRVSVLHYDAVSQPTNPTLAFTIVEGLYLGAAPYSYAFDGWNSGGAAYNFSAPVLGDITLTAQWKNPAIPLAGAGNIVEQAVAYVTANAPAGNAYYLYLGNASAYNVDAQTLSAANFNLTITGLNSERTIQYSGANTGRLFLLDNASARLTIGNNITLKGIAASTVNMIRVQGGTFTMNDGSKITGHTTTLNSGAISVTGANARFIMNGGEIRGNSATNTNTNTSGGIYILTDGSLIMNGGSISGNTGNGIPFDAAFDSGAGAANLSGTAVIGAVILGANSSGNHSSFILNNWNPAAPTTLHLRGVDTAVSAVIGYWLNKPVLQAASGYTLISADAAKFTLGNFYTGTAGTVQPIATTHKIEDTGADIGKLVKK